MVQEEKSIGGQLGRPSGARFRVYERLKTYSTHVEGYVVRDARSCESHRSDLPLPAAAELLPTP